MSMREPHLPLSLLSTCIISQPFQQIQTAIYQIQDVIGSVVLIQHQVLLQPRQEKKLLTSQEEESNREHKRFCCQHIMATM